MRNVVLCAALLIVAAPPVAAQRLPDAVVPEHYTLWFAPDLAKETFSGRAAIRATVTQPTAAITLHSAEIEFGEVRITSGGSTQTARVTTDAAAETATFTVAQPLGEGPVTIEIGYTGVLNSKLRGFYISSANGRKYAVSQMEATDARRAFPSFDEPAFKATFDISMTIDRGDTAISNGRVVSDTAGPEPGRHTVTFARTPKMSTYLVALLVGDFACREGSSEGTPIRVCSTPDKKALTGFALEAAEHQLKYYNDYFGIRYPFGKLDIIAIPDFGAGAMENAGAITFRERLLLVDPRQSSVSARKTVATVLSHEIAHQWFGNLVTMKWWDDIWLNEGFATWMETKAVNDWRPEWQSSLDAVAGTQRALAVDVLPSARSIRTRVETPQDINEVFDPIAYEKTSAVLRMIEAYVGPDAFRRGISSYLNKFAYGNAAGEDFWTEVARVTGQPVNRMFESFVDQAGVPLLTVRQSCAVNPKEISIAQSRLVIAPDRPLEPRTWTFPACVKADGGTARCEVISRPAQTVTANGCSGVLANADARGYYVTEYTPEAIRTLAKQVSTLTRVERLGLIGDEWWMMRSGRHPVGVFLDLAAAFADDDTPIVLSTLETRIGYVADYVAAGPQLEPLQRWIRERFGPVLARIGLPGNPRDPDDVQARRAALVALVGVRGGDPEVQRRARELANQYLADSASLSGSLAPVILQVAAISGDRGLYDRYVAKLAATSAQPEEYYRFFNALPFFASPVLIEETVKLALSPAVRSQDKGTLLRQMLQMPWAREAAWTSIKRQWPQLMANVDIFQGLPRIVDGLGSLCTTAHAADVRAFFDTNRIDAVQRGVSKSIEEIEGCARIATTQSASLSEWLASRGTESPR
jgi:aminopeptidase N